MEQAWPIRLFKRSVLKQKKYQEVTALLGLTEQLRCLDIGADNGVISYLLRQRGGEWKSADLDEQSVCAIRELVERDVYQIDGHLAPFRDGEFDCVVIVDFLEHIPDDREFVKEVYRVMKPGGTLIVNVPHVKSTSLLRWFRAAIGLTDEKHGHIRPGYTADAVTHLLGDYFVVDACRTYSKFFSELIDTLIAYASSRLKSRRGHSRKGTIITGGDLKANRSMFMVYSLLYPLVWLFSKLDALLFFMTGYMLVVRARAKKESTLHPDNGGCRQADQPLTARVPQGAIQ